MADNPYLVQSEDDESVVDDGADYEARKSTILIMILAYMVVLGFIGAFEDPNASSGVSDFLFGLPILVLVISWAKTDAAQRDEYLSRLTVLGLIFVTIAAIPIYLFSTRGWGGFKSVGWLCLYVLALAAASVTGAVPAILFFE